ncbi:hypothetical protein ACWV95_02450 [Streptomyces albus]
MKRWDGIPQVMEPRVYDAMEWFSFDHLPVPGPARGWPCTSSSRATRSSSPPDTDRLVMVPEPVRPGAVPPRPSSPTTLGGTPRW